MPNGKNASLFKSGSAETDFAIWMNLGVIDIALAMVSDWTGRGVIFYLRYQQGKWKTMRVV